MSYVTLDEANEYFSSRLHADSWTEATDSNKKKALSMATKMIDRQPLKGRKTDPSQRSAILYPWQYERDFCCRCWQRAVEPGGKGTAPAVATWGGECYMIQDYLNQTATWHCVTGQNEYGEPVTSSKTIKVRWEGKRRLVRDNEGREVVRADLLALGLDENGNPIETP